MFKNTFRKTLLALAVGGTTLVTGCATSQSKLDEAFIKSLGNTGYGYAQVNSVAPGIATKKACDTEWGGEKTKATRDKICNRLNEFNAAYVSLLKNKGNILASNEIVPTNIELKTGAIVKLDLTKESPFRFVEVVAQEPSDTCKWVGSANGFADDKLTTTGKVVGGFVAGMLVLPAIVIYATGLQGGVECNGWSYKTAYSNFLRDN
jgi:hypothetical protein